ncbi:MAG: hypothetical protein ACF8PN_01930 [Phycisphaerales bacterium]
MVPLAYTAPLGLLAIGALLTYWTALRPGRAPRSRRRIRRANTIVQLMLVPALVYGLSLVDPEVEPSRFIVVWSGVIGLVSLVFLLAILDVWNNIRLTRRDRRAARGATRDRLREALLSGEPEPGRDAPAERSIG